MSSNDLQEVTEPLHIFVISVFIIRGILWFPALFLVHFLLRMEVKGKENLKDIPNGRVIFAANHCSEIDPFAFQYALSFPSKFLPLYFVSLTKNYYTFERFGFRSFFYGGLFFRLMGAYPVYKGLNDYEASFCNHIRILEKNHSVLMFPEGRKRDGKVVEARSGIILLAKRTKSIIVPVKISGNEEMNYKTTFQRKRKLKIIFGKPIDHTLFTIDDSLDPKQQYKAYAKQIMDNIESL